MARAKPIMLPVAVSYTPTTRQAAPSWRSIRSRVRQRPQYACSERNCQSSSRSTRPGSSSISYFPSTIRMERTVPARGETYTAGGEDRQPEFQDGPAPGGAELMPARGPPTGSLVQVEEDL